MVDSKLARQRFFSNQVKMESWKHSMAGKNEDKVLDVVRNLGFVENVDFFRQHPIGERFVIDIAFIHEKVALEVDGLSHNNKQQKSLDRKRDNYLKWNNWVSIRIKDTEFFGYKGSFYKSLILQVIQERRKQWEDGKLYDIEIPNYREEDYA